MVDIVFYGELLQFLKFILKKTFFFKDKIDAQN